MVSAHEGNIRQLIYRFASLLYQNGMCGVDTMCALYSFAWSYGNWPDAERSEILDEIVSDAVANTYRDDPEVLPPYAAGEEKWAARDLGAAMAKVSRELLELDNR
jgi:hypothetical protein